jgi:hypothetical protein
MIQDRKTACALLALTLAACEQPVDDSNIAIDNGVNATEAAEADVETLPPSETSLPATTPAEGAAAQSSTAPVIPAQYRGRWGMVAADCTSTRGDAKGLMTIGDDSIRFYESTATLKQQRPAIATSFSGSYGFTGEGQTWERIVTLTRTGDTLRRADDEGTYTYTRC